MTRRLSAKQVREMHADIAKLVGRSDARAVEMVRRGEHEAADGFPSSSMGGGSSSGIVSRPTEKSALAQPMADPTGDYIAEWEKTLQRMAEDARRLDGLSATVMAIEAGERGRQSTMRQCANPACAIDVLGALRRGRCNACRMYLDRTGMDAPPDVVAKRQGEESAAS